jgi:phage baseplate assembly protein W
MVDQSQAYLGTGWGFPPTFDRDARQVTLVSGKDDIYESLQVLLTTSLGERVMQPTYGCNLTELLFEPLSPSVASNIKELIRTAILYHEPRIRLEAVDLSLNRQLEGVVDIQIDFTILSTNSRFSYVYPFYLKEGAGLAG